MVKKAENLVNQLDFRPISTFSKFRKEQADFGKTMQEMTKTSPQKEMTVKSAEKSETKNPDSLTGKEKAVDGALEKLNQSAKKEVVQAADQEEIPTEEVIAILQSVMLEVKQQFMDVFGITEEELTAAMEKLGLTEEDLGNPQMLTKLAVELSGVEDQMQLLFRPEVTDLLKTVQDKLTEVSEELEKVGMDWNQVLRVQKETSADIVPTEGVVFEVQIDSEQKEITGKETTLVEQNPGGAETTKQETISLTAVEKGSAKQEKNLNGESQNHFSAQVLSHLEEAINERMPEIDARDVIRQVVEEIKLTVKADTSSFEMQLNPEHLGKVNLQIAAKNGVVTAQIATETLEAKEMLEAQITTLKETLERQGVKVEAVEVSVGTRSFDQNLDGQKESDNQQDGQERPRRFRFDVMEAEEGELTTAEQIAREMMMASGNRIDYTA